MNSIHRKNKKQNQNQEESERRKLYLFSRCGSSKCPTEMKPSEKYMIVVRVVFGIIFSIFPRLEHFPSVKLFYIIVWRIMKHMWAVKY